MYKQKTISISWSELENIISNYFKQFKIDFITSIKDDSSSFINIIFNQKIKKDELLKELNSFNEPNLTQNSNKENLSPLSISLAFEQYKKILEKEWNVSLSAELAVYDCIYYFEQENNLKTLGEYAVSTMVYLILRAPIKNDFQYSDSDVIFTEMGQFIDIIEEGLSKDVVEDINYFKKAISIELEEGSYLNQKDYLYHLNEFLDMYGYKNKKLYLLIKNYANKITFQNILKEFNETLKVSLDSVENLESYLTEKFQAYVDKHEDMQQAFDYMDIEYKGLLKKYCVYSMSEDGETWHVGICDDFDENELQGLLNNWNNYYHDNLKNLDELISALEYRVLKDMSNAGCDAITALQMIANDVSLGDYFQITGIADEPKIRLLEIINK